MRRWLGAMGCAAALLAGASAGAGSATAPPRTSLDVDGDGVAEFVRGSRLLMPERRLLLHSGASGAILRDLTSALPLAATWFQAELVPDLSGDGVADVWAHSLDDWSSNERSPRRGSAVWISGADGAPLRRERREEAACCALLSLRGVGFRAVGVGASGTLSTRDPATGSTIWTVRLPLAPEVFGAALAAGPDLDGDDWPELLAGAASQWPGSARGQVFVVAGGSGAVLYSVEALEGGDGFGSSVAWIGVDAASGEPLYAVGAPLGESPVSCAGTFYACRGSTVLPAPRFAGGHLDETWGDFAAGLGDVDQDGFGEWIATIRNEPCETRVFSGRTFEVLFRVDRPDGLNAAVDPIGDVDGDGVAEFLTQASAAPLVHSGRTGAVLFAAAR